MGISAGFNKTYSELFYGSKIKMNILKNNNFFEKKFSLHLGWTLIILGLMVLISILFKVFRIEEFNILLVFLTGVFFIVIKAKNFLYGIFSSVLCVMYFNYFFTEPYHSFFIYDKNTVVTLVIFFAVSVASGIIATKLKQHFLLMSQLEKSKAKIEREKEINMLLRSISHDIRSPLTGIAGTSSFLAENYDVTSKDDAVELLHNMEKDSHYLTQMVENILNMTRIQDGKLKIKKEKDVLDDIISEAASRTVRKDSPCKVVIENDSEIILVPMDSRLILQVFTNIFGNAVKYTPPGTTVTVCSKLDEKNNCAVVTIEDDGNGFSGDNLEKVFEPFYASSSSGDSSRGFGLGLPICRTIIEAHGGTICAENKKEGGARFVIKLPL